MAEQVVYWHSEAPEAHLVRRFIHACLRPLSGVEPAPTLVHSWRAPDGSLAVAQFPGGRVGSAGDPDELAAELRPGRQFRVHPYSMQGATLSRVDTDPAVTTAWTWVGMPPSADLGPSTSALYPVLAEKPEQKPEWEPGQVAVLLDPLDYSRLARELEATAQLRKRFPDLSFQPRWDQQRLDQRAAGARLGVDACLDQVPACEPGTAEVLLVLGQSLVWAPLVLQAVREGRQVLLGAEAEARRPLPPAVSLAWSGTLEGAGIEELVSLLNQLRQDPAAEADRRRRATAWARRWSAQREGQKLLALADSLSARGEEPCRNAAPAASRASPAVSPASAPGRGRRWVVRREVGMGDVLFALSVAAEVKRLEPDAALRFHTAGVHAAWVSWFPQVDEVTHGPFHPEWGERAADFETYFPQTSDLDRTLALGAEIGVVPSAWSPPPVLPVEWEERAAERLRPPKGVRIAFSSASRGHSATRSLPLALAQSIAERLAELGEVLWLDAEAPVGAVPAGVRDLRGALTLPEVWAVMDQCELVVSVDSGLLHVGVTLGKPVVGLFSHIGALQRLWLAPRFIGLQPSLPCAPCGEGERAFHCLRGVTQANEPMTGYRIPPCIELVNASTVAEAARELLALAPETVRYRRVWNLAPDGTRLEWEVDRLPPPHAPLLSSATDRRAALR